MDCFASNTASLTKRLSASDLCPKISNSLFLVWRSNGHLSDAMDVYTEGGRKELVCWWMMFGGQEFKSFEVAISEDNIKEILEVEGGLNFIERYILKIRPDLVDAFKYGGDDFSAARYADWLKRCFPKEYPGFISIFSKAYFSISRGTRPCSNFIPLVPEAEGRVVSASWTRKENVAGKHYINLIGYVKGELGIGEDVRMLYKALKFSTYEINLIDISDDLFSSTNEESLTEEIATQFNSPAINIFCCTAFDHMRVLVRFGADIFVNNYNIGYWPWELPNFPNECLPSFFMVDKVWASTRFIADSVKMKSSVSVVRVPLVVDYDVLPRSRRSEFNIPDDSFVFLFVFDGLSYMDRKNPLFHIKVFIESFRGDENVCLVIKTMNTKFSNKPIWSEILRLVESDKRIVLINETLTKEKLLGLYDVVDAYLSFHRAEGFGRTIAEAMLYEKPVVVSNYSGNRDFNSQANSMLVGGDLVVVEEGQYPFYQQQIWFDPDFDSAVAALRCVYEDEALREGLAANARNDILEYSSINVYKTHVQPELRRIERSLGF